MSSTNNISGNHPICKHPSYNTLIQPISMTAMHIHVDNYPMSIQHIFLPNEPISISSSNRTHVNLISRDHRRTILKVKTPIGKSYSALRQKSGLRCAGREPSTGNHTQRENKLSTSTIAFYIHINTLIFYNED